MISCMISDTISVYAEYNLPELLRESKCLVVEVSNWVAEAYPQPWCILLGSCPNNQAYFEESGRRVQGPQETSAEWKEVGPHNRANHLRPYRDPHCVRCQNQCDHCDGPWKEHLTKQKVIGPRSRYHIRYRVQGDTISGWFSQYRYTKTRDMISAP